MDYIWLCAGVIIGLIVGGAIVTIYIWRGIIKGLNL